MTPRTSLHLDSGRQFRGGQRQVLYLLAGLRERGQSILLCCPQKSPLFERARTAGIPCQSVTLRSGFDFASAMRLARLLRGGSFDLVHAHDAHSHSIARAAQSISRHPALVQNLFVTRRSIGGDPGNLDRLKYSTPGTYYIAISKQVRDSLLRLGVHPDRITIVPSGIETARMAAARLDHGDPWGLRARGRRVIGTVGSLSREKNHAMLLEAFALVRRGNPDSHLLLVGDGPLRPALERRAAALGMQEHVTFAGNVDDVRPAYAAMSAFALSSDTEGLCTALLDAMSAGVPAATTAAGGVLEIARHGDSALVVPPGDAQALAGALSRLLEQPDLSARLVEGGQRVAAAHDVARMVDGTLAAYARQAACGDGAAAGQPAP